MARKQAVQTETTQSIALKIQVLVVGTSGTPVTSDRKPSTGGTEQLLRLLEKGDAFQVLWERYVRQRGIESLEQRGWERGIYGMKQAKR